MREHDADALQEEGSDKYHVLTSSGNLFVTDKLVCCAGAWTNNILQHLGVQLDVEVWRELRNPLRKGKIRIWGC